MALLLFLLTGGALTIVTTPLLKKEKLTWWVIGIVFTSSIIITVNGVYSTCEDSWASSSIGRQGACSWHGGAVARLSDFGWIAIIVSIVIIITWSIYLSVKKKE